MNIHEAYKTLDLAKGLGMERVEEQFAKLRSEMKEKLASTSNERLKQVYTNRLDEIEEAYAVLLKYFEGGVQGVIEGHPIAHRQSTAQQTKASNVKWLLPAAIVFVGLLVSLTLIFLLSAGEATNDEYEGTMEKLEYQKVTIGTQVWMTKNLNVDKFRNGDPIPHVKTSEEWEKAGLNRQPAYCYYDNDPANDAKYGKLYNWYAVNDPRGLAPEGWKIPSDEDWSRLTDFLGGKSVAGKMKSTEFWADDNVGESGNGTNESGFSGLPGGNRDYNDTGSFFNIGTSGGWWSSTETKADNAWYRYLYYGYGDVYRNSSGKGRGLSVRCLRD